MQTTFDELAKGQQRIFDFWKEMTQQMVKAATPAATANPQDGQALLKEWYQRQQAFFTDALKGGGSPQEAFQKAPEQFRNWAQMQWDFSNKMGDIVRQQADKMGVSAPTWEAFRNGNANQYGIKEWSKWLEDSQSWVKDNVLAKMPAAMQPHYTDFAKVYGDLFKYWEMFQQMIQMGQYNREFVEKYFPADTYKDIMSRFMNFRPIHNAEDMTAKVQDFFEQMIQFYQRSAPNGQDLGDYWRGIVKQMGSGQSGAGLDALIQMGDMVNQGLESVYSVAGPGPEVKMAKLLKDVQLHFATFIAKSAELQGKVYQAGQFALPDTLKAFADGYKETKELPDFNAFFNRYVNELENYMLEVLNSKEYSVMQAEVAKLAVGVKAKTDEAIALAFSNTPFLMRGHADEVGKELHSLRQKIRQLEQRLAALEDAAEDQDAPAAPAEKKKRALK